MVDIRMIYLNDHNIYNFFSVASVRDSITVSGKKLFDFVPRQSDTLIVTIGDSWTWGADLTQQKISNAHIDRLVDDHYRVTNMYGNVLASRLAADFLSLGESGAGNWHISKKLKELHTCSDQLPYDRVFVIAVFTELGRDFNGHDDISVDYRSWLLHKITHADDYYKFLSFINQQISQDINSTIEKFDSRYTFAFATNFVDPIGYESLDDRFLPKTWLQIICSANQIEYKPDQCYVVFPWVIEKFQAVFDLAPELDRRQWLEWMNELTDHANIRAWSTA